MKRQEIRGLKRAVTQESSKMAMLALLERSVRFGHKRLALIRCIQAERLGVSVSPAILGYCRHVADGLSAETLQEIVGQAGLEVRKGT